jgi:hypothetical protein
MRNINLVLLPVLGVTSLAGCAMQPDDPQADEASVAEASQPVLGAPAGTAPALAGRALDGRAAAAAEPKVLGASAINPLAAVSSWSSGSVAPGGTQHWFWNNAGTTAAYKVGLSPVGASTTNPCTFQVTRTWDVQQNTGEREFHFTIQNTGAITCGATVLLASQQHFNGAWSTGGIDVGASKGFFWNNANPLTASHVVGTSPTGSTSAHTCDLEASPTWYVQQPGGEREFHFVVTNTGAIACQGDILLALTTSADSSWSTGTISPGASRSWVWNNANPLTRVYVPGLSPAGASGTTPCQLEVTSTSYQQFINPDLSVERKFFLTVKNRGTLSCSGTVLLNNLD